MEETKHIGECYVDAGLIWIGDPCYVWPDEEKQPAAIREVGTWQDLCAKLDGTPYPRRYNFGGLGVVVTSGMGDGVYPVFATIENGTITSVTIDFLCHSEEEEDDDEKGDEEIGIPWDPEDLAKIQVEEHWAEETYYSRYGNEQDE